jgi:hypothetical protein
MMSSETVTGSHVPEPGLLGDRASGFQYADLPLDFVFQSVGKIAERVQILYFRLRSEFRGPAQPNADVGITPQ